MEIEASFYDEKLYIRTTTDNIISRSATILKPQSLDIPMGRVFIGNNVTANCELAPIRIQKYVIIDEGVQLVPQQDNPGNEAVPLTIGSYSRVGKFSRIESKYIGMGCEIGENCLLSSGCVIKDFVKVLPNCVVPCGMVIPPFSIVAGVPAKIIGEAEESGSIIIPQRRELEFRSFMPQR